jgi:hypothetical protein
MSPPLGDVRLCLRGVSRDDIYLVVTLLFLVLILCNLEMVNPILTYKGQMVDPPALLSQYDDKALFLLVDGHVPHQVTDHSGKIWQCLDCGMAVNDKCKLAADVKKNKNKCPSKHANILFPGVFPTTWGRNLDRHQKVWGCPDGHGRVEPLVLIQEEHQLPDQGPADVHLLHDVAAVAPSPQPSIR